MTDKVVCAVVCVFLLASRQHFLPGLFAQILIRPSLFLVQF